MRIFNSTLAINKMLLWSSVFVASLVATTTAQNAPQCCEKLLSSDSPAVEPFLGLLSVTIPIPPVDLGICCKPISVSGCESNCTSPLFGADTGDAFNDLTTLVVNGTVTTDDVPSIQAITFRYGSVIDGLAVTYAQGTGQDLTTISHGTSLTAVDSGLKNSTVTLGTNETITAVSGQTGFHTSFGVRVLQLSLTISNSFTGASRPFGTAASTAFTVAGNGTVIALGGSAVNTNLSRKWNLFHGNDDGNDDGANSQSAGWGEGRPLWIEFHYDKWY
ncbi:hypothetical protein B0H10DRAFT_2217647 [Mycena sp. CBHHK59/15]|nr:hypothetical protein B0H10DRAFT_2217647 [Mycena sp. CBHHK59/15]